MFRDIQTIKTKHTDRYGRPETDTFFPSAKPKHKKLVLRESFQKDQKKTHGDFETLVGKEGWQRLRPAIQDRFCQTNYAKPTLYKGTMTTIERNPVGFVMAQMLRLFGMPLATFSAANIPAEVRVYPDEGGKGIVWDRHYLVPDKGTFIFRSTKVLEKKPLDVKPHSGHHEKNGLRLLECVKGGLGMHLRVFEDKGALHFKSNSYFLRWGHLTLRVPVIFTPGQAHVSHTDRGDGWFRFTLIFSHPLWGQTFFQDGLFKECDKHVSASKAQ